MNVKNIQIYPKWAEDESDEIYSLDLVSTKGSNIHSQTFRLPESESAES